MKLYLMQHGEAKSKKEDPDRPLTEKGQEKVEFISAFVARHVTISISQILHSGKMRAQETAELAAEQFRPAKGIAVAKDLDPMADPNLWARRIEGMEDDLMLVGHLPHLGNLAGTLLCDRTESKPIAFQMGGIICLERDEYRVWSVAWMLTPGILKPGPKTS
jgi:phosphohistidine phosphatase